MPSCHHRSACDHAGLRAFGQACTLASLAIIVGCLLPACASPSAPAGDAASADATARADWPATADLPRHSEAATMDASPPLCDLVEQTGCRAGEKCTLVGGRGSKLACAADAARAEGEECRFDGDGIDDCRAGLICPGDTYRCLEVCRGPADCPTGRGCHGVVPESSDPPTRVCVPTCDLFAHPPDCPAQMGCYVMYPDGGGGCMSEGSTDVGGSCQRNSDCKSGLLCLPTDPSASDLKPKCHLPCLTTGAQPCPSGSCQSFFVGDGTLGYCQVP